MTFDIEFRPGVKNQNADLLSRYPVIPLPTKAGKGTEDSSTFRNPATVAALAQVLALDGRSPSQLVSEEPPDTDLSTSSDSTVGPSISQCEDVARVWAHLQEYQNEDEYCQQWIRFIHHGEFPDDDREAREMALQQGQFCMQGGILYRIVDGREQVVVPEALKPIVLYQCHTGTGGHLGVKKTQARLTSRYFWPRLSTSIMDYIRSCEPCQLSKDPPRRHRQKLGARDTPDGPWQVVHFDIWSPGPGHQPEDLPPCPAKHVIAFIDAFTKYVVAYAIPNRRAETIARIIGDQLIPTYGPPMQFVSDNAREFTAPVQQEIFEMFGITHQLIAPLAPKSNGQIERFFRPLRAMLAAAAIENPWAWHRYLSQVIYAYNTSVHCSTGNTPFFLMFARDPEILLHNTVPDPREENQETPSSLFRRITVARELVKEKLEQAAEAQAHNYNKKAQPREYTEGQLVLIHSPVPAHALGPRKLVPQWVGPFRVYRVYERTVLVKPISFPYAEGRVIHKDRLKPFYGTAPVIDMTFADFTVGDHPVDPNLDAEADSESDPDLLPSRT